MSCFKAKNAPNLISAGTHPQTTLGELTALPQAPYLDLSSAVFTCIGALGTP